MPERSPQDLSAVDWPLRTDRLLLRPATVEDADAVYDTRSIEQVGTWLSEWPRDRERHRLRFVDPDRLSRTLMIERIAADGGRPEVIGDLYLSIRDAWAQPAVADRAKDCEAEIGWTLRPCEQGNGYATEAVGALIDACFGPLGLRRLTAVCFAVNEPSWRLMERLGMRREAHTVAESLHESLGWMDSYGYALLADEWPADRV